MLASDSFENLTTLLMEFNKDDLHIGYGGGLTYNTPLGPISIFFAGNNKKNRPVWYINMGYPF